MSSQVAELLADIAATAPHLAGAACVGRWELFDVETRDDARTPEAVAICQRCPALPECRTWLDSLKPSQRPMGVVAGRFVQPRGLLKAPTPPARATAEQRRPTKLDAATDWLADYLRTHGPTPGREVIAAAAAAGIRRGTLFAARNRLGVIAPPRHGMKAHESPVWRLPETALERPQDDENPTDEELTA